MKHRDSRDDEKDEDEDGKNMSSHEFVMRTMIPSSQRATKEYKNREELIGNFADDVEVQQQTDNYTPPTAKSGEPPQVVASQAAAILNVNPPSFGHTGSKGSRFVKTMSGVMHHKIPSDSRYNAPSNEDFNLGDSSEEEGQEVNDDQAPPVQDVVMIS